MSKNTTEPTKEKDAASVVGQQRVVMNLDSSYRKKIGLMEPIDPQPPKGIKYILGGESWLKPKDRSPVRLHCEEWGNLGPMELDPEIKPNKAGFRVRSTDFFAPEGANGFTTIDGVYYWTAVDCYEKYTIEKELGITA